MVRGIGTDIELVSRIKAAAEKGSFLCRFFTEKENEYFRKKNNSFETIAGCFCVKEAASKALGTGLYGFSLKDIEVLHDEKGKPYIRLHNYAKQLFEDMGGKKIFVSISHTKENAIAFVVID